MQPKIESTLRDSIEWESDAESSNFKIFVENPGRINFENRQSLDGEYKGLVGHLALTVKTDGGYKSNCKFSKDWDITSLPMNPEFISNIPFQVMPNNAFTPGFHKFVLNVRRTPRDSFLDPIKSGFTKVIF